MTLADVRTIHYNCKKKDHTATVSLNAIVFVVVVESQCPHRPDIVPILTSFVFSPFLPTPPRSPSSVIGNECGIEVSGLSVGKQRAGVVISFYLTSWLV